MNDKGGIFYGSFKPCKPDTVNYGINNKRYSVLIPFKINFFIILLFVNLFIFMQPLSDGTFALSPETYNKSCSFSRSQVSVMELLFMVTSPSVCTHKGAEVSMWTREA